ncbi:MAG: CsgG/HfaB family protein [Pseudomonadota bacterium]
MLTFSSCATPAEGLYGPTSEPTTQVKRELNNLPAPVSRIAVAVYNFEDQTGAFEPAEQIQNLSKAVTQGGASLLIRSLQEAGSGSWFTVVERESLNNLLKERQLVREMRQRYLGETTITAEDLPPLLLAGVLMEGGIIGFDSNTMTGGAGARLLGIGASTQYRQDTVTIYLRAVSVKSGEVLANVVTHKTVVSTLLRADTFRFISFDDILEAEAGITRNEPRNFAVQQAIDKAVLSLIAKGARKGLWSFADQAQGQTFLDQYALENGLDAETRQFAGRQTGISLATNSIRGANVH